MYCMLSFENFINLRFSNTKNLATILRVVAKIAGGRMAAHNHIEIPTLLVLVQSDWCCSTGSVRWRSPSSTRVRGVRDGRTSRSEYAGFSPPAWPRRWCWASTGRTICSWHPTSAPTPTRCTWWCPRSAASTSRALPSFFISLQPPIASPLSLSDWCCIL